MIPAQVRIFVCTERQDMRRSFDALALAVRERLALEPESGALANRMEVSERRINEFGDAADRHWLT